jgi:hypothetical protein
MNANGIVRSGTFGKSLKLSSLDGFLGSVTMATTLSAPAIAFHALRGAGKLGKLAMSATNAPSMGYGKRGLDSNNMNTDGLVQSMYRRRRSGE